MELKATRLGQYLAQHPYSRAEILHAGIEMSGEKHQYVIPFNQLIEVRVKRGLVWGELEFELSDEKVVRLHGTEWKATQHFHQALLTRWHAWGEEISPICSELLQQQVALLQKFLGQDCWLSEVELKEIQQSLRQAFSLLPMPQQRLNQFDDCRINYQHCLLWLDDGEQQLKERNEKWVTHTLSQHAVFFDGCSSGTLDIKQSRLVINDSPRLMIEGMAGTGKTTTLLSRASWLLYRQYAAEGQILLLSGSPAALKQLAQRAKQYVSKKINVYDINSLAQLIIDEAANKPLVLSKLVNNETAKQAFLIKAWQIQCQEKKAMAVGWSKWLQEGLGWSLEENFWHDETICEALGSRLSLWLSLMRQHGGSQSAMIDSAPKDISPHFSQLIKLMAPLLKAWKSELKESSTLDHEGLLQQAINLVEKGRFVSPYHALCIDDYHALSPLARQLVAALTLKSEKATLLLTTDAMATAGTTDFYSLLCDEFDHMQRETLETVYRFNQYVIDTALPVLPNGNKMKALSVFEADRRALSLIADNKLEALLDKISGFAEEQSEILVLALYPHQSPLLLKHAKIRWPTLNLRFLTFKEAKGCEADMVIVIGLSQGLDSFPRHSEASLLAKGLFGQSKNTELQDDDYNLYLSLTRASSQTWLLYNAKAPSIYVERLQRSGVTNKKRF